jgi:hemerythrin-like metal-binding protein
MNLLSWSRACTVGVQAMDDQHGILMDTVNELRLAAVRGSSQERVSELLNRLIQFTRMHFRGEEQLMEQHVFPGLAEHRIEHQRMMAQLLRSSHRARHGEKVQMRPLLGFLRESYAAHIDTIDRKYGTWLNERGVN